ncbi:MAG TPA: S8 family serine peptidase, partial [Ferruginibacter sp.]|nr:S8 family serine peptidase [Ferruginibacter sp.]
TVGASGNLKNGGITASFSNYGKSEVDVFAPGVNIYSTLPGENMYGVLSGTSFSGPVVAGIAALIMEYYPALSPQQVIMAIEKTAVFPNEKVLIPGTDEKVDMRQLSKTGIVNAFEAIKYASTIKPAIQKEVLPKSKIKKEKLG